MAAIPINIAEHVGNTPMVRLTRLVPEGVDVRALRQARGVQPGRQRQGPDRRRDDRGGRGRGPHRAGPHDDRRGDVSGNTGIALAFCCAAKGYDLMLILPQGMSREREALLRLYGARVEVTESLGGMNEAVDAARAMARRRRRLPARPVLEPRQPGGPPHGRPARRSCARSTAASTCSSPGVGTGGTITGVGEALKASATPDCSVVAVEPRRSAVLSGGPPGPHRIQGIGAGFVPAVLNRELLDEVIAVSRRGRDRRPRACSRAREGMLAGISCGAAVWAALEVAKRPESRGKRIVAVLPDSGERYVSTPFFAPRRRTRAAHRHRSSHGACRLGDARARSRGEIRCDVAAAPRARPGRARRRRQLEILAHLAGRPRAARPPRRARAARGAACRCCRG